MTIEVVGLEIDGAGEFEGLTLAYAESVRAGVDLRRLVQDEQLLIESVVVREPKIRLFVNEDGKANYDIAKPASREEPKVEEESAGLTVRLQQLEIVGGRLEHEAPGTKIRLEGLVHDGSATVEGAS